MTADAHARQVLWTRDLLFTAWLAIPAVIGLVVASLLGSGGRGSAWPEIAALAALACGGYPIVRFRRLDLPRSRTVRLDEAASPELHALVRQLAAQLDVPAPTTLELSPDCDAWLEPRAAGAALVIGSPLLWWLRVTEIRGLLAPVVAGATHMDSPRVRAARHFSLRLDALADRRAGRGGGALVRRLAAVPQRHARAMEYAIATQAAALSAAVEPAGRIVAHEQVGLIVTAWDRVLTRLATPAWERGCAPVALGAALVAALTELGSRDRLSHELSTRLAERPACDLLEEPGRYDALVSGLAAAVFAALTPRRHVEWDDYVPEVVEPGRRALAATAAHLPAVAPLVSALANGEHRCAPHRSPAMAERWDAGGRRRGVATAEPPIEAEAGTGDPRDGLALGELGLDKIGRSAADGRDNTTAAGGLGALTAYDAALDAAAAAVECAAVDLGVARWRLDWLDGVVLRRPGGGILPVSDLVARAVATGDLSPLRVVLG